MNAKTRAALMSLGLAAGLAACSKKAPEQPAPVPSETRSQTSPPPPTPREERTDDSAAERAAAARRAAIEQRIHFEYNQSRLTSEAQQILRAKAEALRVESQVTIRVEGHADERGSDEYNLALSNQRAAEAKRFLVQLGIDGGRIAVAGLGEEQPLDNRSNETAWALNRRAEFRPNRPMADR
ncbi:MAG: OmpA family protein [Gemmatimonadales bacterium]